MSPRRPPAPIDLAAMLTAAKHGKQAASLTMGNPPAAEHTAEVDPTPPRVLRAFLDPTQNEEHPTLLGCVSPTRPNMQVDMLEGDSLLLINRGGELKVVLESGGQFTHVLEDYPCTLNWFKLQVARVWHEDAAAMMTAKRRAKKQKQRRGGKRG